MLRRSILNKDLIRPNWIKQEHRSIDKIWLDRNECADPEMHKIVMESLSKVTPELLYSFSQLDILYG